MTRSLDLKWLLAALALAAAVLLWAVGGPGGIGGTGMTGGGVGGTGVQPSSGGFGGTGIFGRINGFGSIWVNGYKVHYPDTMIIDVDGREQVASTLALGQVVAVVAEQVDGKWQAQSIKVLHEVAGPVKLDSSRPNELTVLNQQIQMTSSTVLAGATSLAEIQQNHVTVSGFRKTDGTILASRVEVSQPSDSALLRGQLERDGDIWTVSGVPTDLEQNDLTSGEQVLLSGNLDTSGFRVARAQTLTPLPFDRPVTNVSYQGIYQTDDDNNSSVNISGLQLSGTTDKLPLNTEQLQLVSGKLSDTIDEQTQRPVLIMETFTSDLDDAVNEGEQAEPEGVPEQSLEETGLPPEGISQRDLHDDLSTETRAIVDQTNKLVSDAIEQANQSALEAEQLSQQITDQLPDTAHHIEETTLQIIKQAQESALAAEGNALQIAQEAEEAALEAAREAEEAALNAAREAEEAALNAAREAEEAALNAAREAEEAALNAAREAEEAALEAAREAEEAALEAAREAEEAALEAAREAEEAALEAAREAEEAALEAVREVEEAVLEATREVEEAALEAAREAEEAALEAARDAAREAEEEALERLPMS